MTQPAEIVTLTPQTWAYVTCRSGLQPSEISATTDKAFAELAEAIARGGVRTNGPPYARYHYRDQHGIGFDLGFPIISEDAPAAERAGLTTGPTLSGRVMARLHQGPYAGLSGAYRELEQNLKAKGLAGCGDVWEVYLNDPDNTAPEALRTQIYWPISEGAAISQHSGGAPS
jgi:effector-binding domain-containing protein